MNLQQFQYVLAVVDSKNFDAAAEKCFVTQSTLSTMIGRLEDEIGIKIFNRKTKPVSITPEGKDIINVLRVILNDVDALKNVVQELKGEMVGTLKIGIIPTIAPYLIPLFLSDFAETFPEVQIVVKEITTNEIEGALLTRDLDIGILALPLHNDQLNELELYNEPFVVYDCESDKMRNKIRVEDLDFSKLWLLQEGHCLRTQIHQICELANIDLESKSNIEFESASMDSLLRFTQSSKGITILPYMASAELSLNKKQRLIEFESPVPVRSVGMLTHKNFVKQRLLSELQKIIREKVNKILPQNFDLEVIRPY